MNLLTLVLVLSSNYSLSTMITFITWLFVLILLISIQLEARLYS